MTDVWNDLSLFESSDLVKRFYVVRHNHSLSAKKAWVIVSRMAQGRRYFESASQSADLIRPLLVYYGVLSITRSVILFLNTKAQSSNIAQSHGLSERGWAQELALNGGNIPQLVIEVTKGTFAELCLASHNIGFGTIRKADYNFEYGKQSELLRTRSETPRQEYWSFFGTTPIRLGMTLTVGDILGRIPRLRSLYMRLLRADSHCFRTEVYIDEVEDFAHVEIYQQRFNELNAEQLRSLLLLPQDLKIAPAGAMYTPFRYRLNGYDEMRRSIPNLADDEERRAFAITPVDGDVQLSQMMLLYLVAYVLGMLARYFPEHWMALLGNRESSAIYPLLRAALDCVETQFPEWIHGIMDVSAYESVR